MWLDVVEFVCTTACGMQALISWRLLKQGWNLSFINLLLAIHFFMNSINSYIYIYLLFDIGSKQLFDKETDPEDISVVCKYYISSWLALYTIGSIPSLGIVFCRFIYARYSHGLVADMGKLFHKIVLIGISMFTLHWILVWPLGTKVSKNDYKNIIKGQICNQIPFPDIGDVEFHVKPKMVTVFIVGLYMLSLAYIHSSSNKQTKFHGIPKRRWNLLTINQHALYLHLTGICVEFDQLVINIILQVFNTEIGPKNVFRIWWFWHLVMFFIANVIATIVIIIVAEREYPEFNGLSPKTYPGQEKPRSIEIHPRRDFIGLGGNVYTTISKPSCSRSDTRTESMRLTYESDKELKKLLHHVENETHDGAQEHKPANRKKVSPLGIPSTETLFRVEEKNSLSSAEILISPLKMLNKELLVRAENTSYNTSKENLHSFNQRRLPSLMHPARPFSSLSAISTLSLESRETPNKTFDLEYQNENPDFILSSDNEAERIQSRKVNHRGNGKAQIMKRKINEANHTSPLFHRKSHDRRDLRSFISNSKKETEYEERKIPKDSANKFVYVINKMGTEEKKIPKTENNFTVIEIH